MDAPAAARILLVDDHGIVRRGIKTLLQLSDPTLHIDDVSSLSEAVSKLQGQAYTFSLVDLHLSGGESGLDLIGTMHDMQRGLPAIVLSGEDDRDTIMQCIERGAAGFITKSSEDEMVFRVAIETVLSGRIYLPSSALGRGGHSPMLPRSPKVTALADLKLRPKLAETLACVYRGLSNKSIANQMHISEYTARDYCSELYREFGVAKRAQLIVELARRGVVISDLR